MIAELLSCSHYSLPSESPWAEYTSVLLDMQLPNSCDDKTMPLIQGSEEIFS